MYTIIYFEILKLYKIYAEPALHVEDTSTKTFLVHLHLCGNSRFIIPCH